ncbi:hypothetical protein TI39_contig395g00007 [Zymoseptoria brevis]|uniref:Uncharacterized protein n=1 Tax=Zymoseptoria brevis TaxID=1047168 RepID=A0A0F4GNB5_9PEZI|nr:hypothetical protein TI39_contig395g00007 [Zymoseptoria brevis]
MSNQRSKTEEEMAQIQEFLLVLHATVSDQDAEATFARTKAIFDGESIPVLWLEETGGTTSSWAVSGGVALPREAQEHARADFAVRLFFPRPGHGHTAGGTVEPTTQDLRTRDFFLLVLSNHTTNHANINGTIRIKAMLEKEGSSVLDIKQGDSSHSFTVEVIGPLSASSRHAIKTSPEVARFDLAASVPLPPLPSLRSLVQQPSQSFRYRMVLKQVTHKKWLRTGFQTEEAVDQAAYILRGEGVVVLQVGCLRTVSHRDCTTLGFLDSKAVGYDQRADSGVGVAMQALLYFLHWEAHKSPHEDMRATAASHSHLYQTNEGMNWKCFPQTSRGLCPVLQCQPFNHFGVDATDVDVYEAVNRQKTRICQLRSPSLALATFTHSLTVSQENAAIAGMRNILAQAGVQCVLVEAEENEDDGKFRVVTTRVQVLVREMGRVREVSGVQGFEISDGLEDIVRGSVMKVISILEQSDKQCCPFKIGKEVEGDPVDGERMGVLMGRWLGLTSAVEMKS